IAAAQIDSSDSTTSSISVDAIVSKHLFGDAAAKPVEQPIVEETVAATETRLPLKLKGIYAADDDTRASAIIEAAGKQKVYFIGEPVDGAQGAKLHQVKPQQVILQRAGRFESLTLIQQESVIDVVDDRRSKLSAVSIKPKPRLVDNPRVKRELTSMKEKFQDDPSSLKDAIRYSIYQEDGEVKGFKISPGKSRQLFVDLGLRRNDIVTSLNGIDITDLSQMDELKEIMNTADEVSLTILRNGQPQDISVVLSDQNSK
ncbi:MAG: type II secretion system protein GspC, partial [Kangiellaceae bacterium]|nr:type II secretion system protein GspC [Kangiellaceae bacterium]